MKYTHKIETKDGSHFLFRHTAVEKTKPIPGSVKKDSPTPIRKWRIPYSATNISIRVSFPYVNCVPVCNTLAIWNQNHLSLLVWPWRRILNAAYTCPALINSDCTGCQMALTWFTAGIETMTIHTPRKPRFDPSLVDLGFVVDWEAAGQVFASSTSVFLC